MLEPAATPLTGYVNRDGVRIVSLDDAPVTSERAARPGATGDDSLPDDGMAAGGPGRPALPGNLPARRIFSKIQLLIADPLAPGTSPGLREVAEQLGTEAEEASRDRDAESSEQPGQLAETPRARQRLREIEGQLIVLTRVADADAKALSNLHPAF